MTDPGAAVRPGGERPRGALALSDLLAGLEDVSIEGPAGVSIRRLAAHSADCGPGALFFAIRGARFDGGRFVPRAVRAGAVAVAHERSARPTLPRGVARVVTGDVRLLQARAASRFFGEAWRSVPVVGVTGTNGKTTVTWMLATIGEQAGGIFARVGTVEHRVGRRREEALHTTPGAIEVHRWLARARRARAPLVALEVSSHAIDQRRVEAIGFAGAVLTNLAPEHLDYHGSMQAYARAKGALFERLPRDAFALLPEDEPFADDIARRCPARVFRFGRGSGAQVRLRVRSADLSRLRFDLHGPWGEVRGLEVRAAGALLAENAAAAAAAALLLGVGEAEVRRGLSHFAGVPGRLEPVEGPPGSPRVLVDYAHTDHALGAVLKALRPFVPGRLVTVFGCGGERDRRKRPRMGRVAAELSDIVVVTSDNPRGEDPLAILEEILRGVPAAARSRLVVEPDRREAIRAALRSAGPGDLVLIAGKGHEREQLVGGRRIPFDDRKAAREELWNRS